MWKVGGIKIETAAGGQFVLWMAMEILERQIFFTLRAAAQKQKEILRWVQKVK